MNRAGAFPWQASLRRGALDAAWLRRAEDLSPARFPDPVRAAPSPGVQRAVRQRRRTMQTRRALCPMAPALRHRLPMVRRWLARRRARSAARPARATRLPTASRCWSAQAQPAPGAARSVRCCLPRSGRRDCHRENRTAGSRRSQARRAPRQSPAIAPAGWRRLPAIGLRAARSAAGADRPVRRFVRQALRHRLRQTSERRPDWPTGFVCRRPSTAMRAGGSSRRPPVADRRRPCT